MKENLIIAGVIVFLIIIMTLFSIFYSDISRNQRYDEEGFASKPEKAQMINNWFLKNAENPTYTKYRDSIEDANIVEYEDSLKLHKSQKLTPGNIILKL